MLTPINEAIKEIDTWTKLDALKKNDPYDRGFVSGLNRALDILKFSLPKEKEVIESAFNRGWFEFGGQAEIHNGEDYYNKTFKQ